MADSSPVPSRPDWHARPAEEVLALLDATRAGLSSAEAADRLHRHGPNETAVISGRHPLRLLWEQLSAVMVVILIGAAALSFVLGKYLEAAAIGAIVVLFSVLGFLQEFRAERAIAALRQLTVPFVRAVRDGRTTEVAASSLVPGDVVLLEAGSIVPADLRLLDVASLRIQEATLTGESEPVDKVSSPIPDGDAALGDRRCMAYSGTEVAHGRGTGVAVATGMTTELGHIATLLQAVEAEDTPLQARLDRVGKQLAVVGVGVALVVMGLGALAGETFADLVLTAISVAVAVIPEGLPAVVTFTLAIGAQRMLRRQALIRKLPAVETLGSVTVICSDKTGTLTQNRMTLTTVHTVAGRHPVPAEDGRFASADVVLTTVVASLCNDGDIHQTAGSVPELVGDPTETAILRAAHELGVDVDAVRAGSPRVGEHPFDPVRKRMSTVHGPLSGHVPELASLPQDQHLAFVKGAVDGMVEHLTHRWDGADPVVFDAGVRSQVLAANDEMAAAGMRVLAVAYRPLGSSRAPVEEVEDGLVLVGLVGLIDPPRVEVRAAVATCVLAGIRPVMITGDHPLTARAIATDLGIGAGSEVITGPELEHLDRAGLDAAVERSSVFARVSPEHKLRLVETFQRAGHVVAMTGDGVNDAPALKRADIGVAMGITGTDVSKEASDMVLRDDNFATIVGAVEEGRVIYDNLRRFVSFAVAGNLGKIIVMVGWPLPFLVSGASAASAVALLPLQLLWLNLMTDGLLGLSMGLEPAERRVMTRAPHRPGASLWAGGLGRHTLAVGTIIGAVALLLGFLEHEAGRAEWQTMMFTSLAFLQVFQALGIRSHTESLRSIGWAGNKAMLATVALVSGLQLVALYTPVRRVLDLEPLGAVDLAVCVGAGCVLLGLLEGHKWWRRVRGGPDADDDVRAPMNEED